MKATLFKLKDISESRLKDFEKAQEDLEINNDFEIDDFSAMTYFDMNDEKCCVVFLDDIKTNAVITAWTERDVVSSYEDVTNKIIAGKLNTPVHQDLDFFKNEIRKEQTTIDDVLDKISQHGIESLDAIDKEILKMM